MTRIHRDTLWTLLNSPYQRVTQDEREAIQAAIAQFDSQEKPTA